MKRQISSKTTILLKIILPIIFTFQLTAMLFLMFFSFGRNEYLALKFFFPVMIVVGLFALFRTTMKYKKVALDDEFLYVSNYLKEIKIPLSHVGDVTEFKWIRNRPITIHLRTESEFGRKITFTPKSNGFRIFADNPMIAELKAAAQAAGAGTNFI